MFQRYPHLERHGTTEVENIEAGECYIFPKIDGTNASIWYDGQLRFGSRNRELSLEKDNGGFMQSMHNSEQLKSFFAEFPHYRLFGEWMIPHTLKTYRPDVWNKFYIFDVAIDTDNGYDFVPYKVYKEHLDKHGLNYLPPLKIIINPTTEDLLHCLEINTFLIQEGQGVGEGIVIKNYGFYNQFGRQVWAKWVTSEFKEKNYSLMGSPEKVNVEHEQRMVEQYVLQTDLAQKTLAKIELVHGGWSSKNIPQLLNTVFYELVTEEMWNYVKNHSKVKIDFSLLQALCFQATKTKLPHLF